MEKIKVTVSSNEDYDKILAEAEEGMNDVIVTDDFNQEEQDDEQDKYNDFVTESKEVQEVFLKALEETAQLISAQQQQEAKPQADVTVKVAGTEEEVKKAVEEGKGLGQRMGEFLSKFPQTVKAFNAKPREKQFDYARSVIEGLYLQGKHLAETIPLTDEFMELDEREETGEEKEKSLVQIIKTIAVKVIAATVGFVVETVFFTLDVVLESAACLTRIASHVVVELGYTGQQITKSFKRHYLNK